MNFYVYFLSPLIDFHETWNVALLLYKNYIMCEFHSLATLL